MKHLLLSLSIMALLSAGNFSCSKTDNMSIKKPDGESGFVIYFYKNSETSKYETDTYKYDSSWINFLNSAPLSGVKITDENIESYDWEKQRGWFTPFGDIMKKAS